MNFKQILSSICPRECTWPAHVDIRIGETVRTPRERLIAEACRLVLYNLLEHVRRGRNARLNRSGSVLSSSTRWRGYTLPPLGPVGSSTDRIHGVNSPSHSPRLLLPSRPTPFFLHETATTLPSEPRMDHDKSVYLEKSTIERLLIVIPCRQCGFGNRDSWLRSILHRQLLRCRQLASRWCCLFFFQHRLFDSSPGRTLSDALTRSLPTVNWKFFRRTALAFRSYEFTMERDE